MSAAVRINSIKAGREGGGRRLGGLMGLSRIRFFFLFFGPRGKSIEPSAQQQQQRASPHIGMMWRRKKHNDDDEGRSKRRVTSGAADAAAAVATTTVSFCASVKKLSASA